MPRWSGKSVEVLIIRADLLTSNSIKKLVCSLVAMTMTQRLGLGRLGRSGSERLLIVFIVEPLNVFCILKAAIRNLCALHD